MSLTGVVAVFGNSQLVRGIFNFVLLLFEGWGQGILVSRKDDTGRNGAQF